ncbi:hypothetical protein AAA799E16_01400 [Marine Group I thaumarchaeote SCGC AAA799-E16]|uniref:Uncharacterized protein n=2 Tax=Marine Group I TaxID=905826 RepID=A0A087RXV2_9ARCH|nr:hypothetical protein AAA799E16_01400 [Marine Group I thaumarchaeote SCGC AAA799-E16]KFM18306.1 hypothetical protein SCCGRSA3_01225 [Marine Group I thaumarchaeote SCGC RSA3]
MNKKEELHSESIEIDEEVFDNLDALIKSNWDSNYLKSQIVMLLKQKERIEDEIEKITN